MVYDLLVPFLQLLIQFQFMNNYGRDFLGHGLIETYMNPAFGMYESIKGHVDQALTELKAPPTQASQGFFTAHYLGMEPVT